MGEMELSSGSATVKPLNGAVPPASVVTLTVRTPAAAPGAIVTTRVTLVEVQDVRAPLTPAPLNVTLDAPVKDVPKIVTVLTVSGAPEFGLMDEIAGTPIVRPLKGAVVPPVVTAVTVRRPAAAPGEIVSTTEMLADVHDETSAVTPAPLSVTSDAPVRFCPLRVAATIVPGAADPGEIVCSTGRPTVKPNEPTVPFGVVTLTVRAPNGAPGSIFNATDTDVDVQPVMTGVIPVPLTLTLAEPLRPAPKITASIVVPGAPDDGLMKVSAAAATVKPLNGTVVPPGVVAVMVRKPVAAPAATVIASDMDDELTLVMAAVTPVPLNTTAVVPDRFCPNSVAVIVLAGAAVAGEIEVIEGAAIVNPKNGGIEPPSVSSVMLRRPIAAPGAIDTDSETLEAVCEVMAADMPEPLNVTPVAVARFTPPSVTKRLVPGDPDPGVTWVIAGALTMKAFTGVVVRNGVVKVAVRRPGAALTSIAAATVRVVAVIAVIVPVTPIPLNVMPVTLDRFRPWTVAITEVPGAPDGAEIDVITGNPTSNPLSGAVGPAGVITVTVLAPAAAPGAIVMATEILVADTDVIDPVTPLPLNVTPVAPSRFAPAIVAATVVPAAPDAGNTEVITGEPIVKPMNGAVTPPGVVTVTVREPGAAPASIVTATATLAAVAAVTDAVTPVPPIVTAVAPERFWPEIVAETVVPGAPEEGERLVITGIATAKPGKASLVPPGVAKVALRGPNVAPGAIVTTMVICVGPAPVMVPVTPDPLNETPLAADNACPVTVTEKLVPGAPEAGNNEVIAGFAEEETPNA